jgi:hypothetical protein
MAADRDDQDRASSWQDYFFPEHTLDGSRPGCSVGSAEHPLGDKDSRRDNTLRELDNLVLRRNARIFNLSFGGSPGMNRPEGGSR